MTSHMTAIDPNESGSDTDDSDFAASDSYGSDYYSSSSEHATLGTKSKRATGPIQDTLASGDEGIVESGKRKRKRKHKRKGKRKGKERQDAGDVKDEDGEEDEEEGVGARLRRRRNGRAERESNNKRLGLGISDAATIDVDNLWQRLASAPTKPADPPPDADDEKTGEKAAEAVLNDTRPSADASTDMIAIKRTYTFAGTTTTEEKLVPRESAEARLYLSTKPVKDPKDSASNSSTTSGSIRRPLRRPSRFDDPNPAPNSLLKTTASIKSHLAPTAANNAGMSAVQRKLDQGQKLNTVEKSRLDWAGYVDKEKLKDELDVAEKAKGSYLDRMEFLGKSEQAREDGLREGRRR